MKQKDIALIIIVVAISGAVSLFVSRTLFVSSKDRQQEAEVVEAIDTNFPSLDNSSYFNTNSINPTQLIQIGGNNNTNPFNASQPQ